jgi:gluconokinase
MPEMSGPAVLAVDIGSSSVRASIYDSRLTASRSHQIRYRWQEHQDGRSELRPDRLERVVLRAIDVVLEGRRSSPIAAVVIAAFWHSLMGVDAHGHPTTALMPWSDLRAEGAVARLRRKVDEKRVHTRTGCRLHASYWPARLVWCRRWQPAIFERTLRWIGFGEWLQQRWLGWSATSISQASATGLMIQSACEWDPELLRVCGIDRAALSPIVDTSGNGGALGERLVARWPALRSARWLPVLGDGAINNVGAGCTTPGRAAIMIGTSGAVRMLWEPPPGQRMRIPFALWRYRLDRRRVVVGGALSNGGNVIRVDGDGGPGDGA